MKAGASKAKGSSFENKISKQLSLWVTKGERQDVLMRSPGSGAKATVLSYAGLDFSAQAGDIIAVREEGMPLTAKFILELKHYKNLYVENLIFGTRNDGILLHWDKLQKEAKKYNKIPMYIARQNGKQIILGLNSAGVTYLNCHLSQSKIAFFYKLDLYLFAFDDFLNEITFT